MQATFAVVHEPFDGATSVDGYPETPTYGVAVNRLAFAVQPESQDTETDGEHAGRITTRKLVAVPSVDPYGVFDKVTVLSEVFIVKEIRDFTTGPFGYRPGGALIVERTDG